VAAASLHAARGIAAGTHVPIGSNGEDAPVLTRMTALSAQYPRYGYRRIAIFLARDGHPMSFGRAHRLWRLARLQVPRRRPRKRIAAGRPRPNAATGANQSLSPRKRGYGATTSSSRSEPLWRMINVRHVRERPEVEVPDRARRVDEGGFGDEVDGRIRSAGVIAVLTRLVSERGVPLHLRSDNGPEFVSRALLKWITDQGIATALIDPGKPWQNGTEESFNGKFRDECLSLEWFRSRPRRRS
jgi:putative transposase